MPDRLKDRRKTERYPFPASIQYGLNGGSDPSLSKAVTMNVSSSGLCMYLFEKMEKGQEITINDEHPALKGRARVQWINKLENSFFIAGLEFLR